jgi:hypothetical protein
MKSFAVVEGKSREEIDGEPRLGVVPPDLLLVEDQLPVLFVGGVETEHDVDPEKDVDGDVPN